MNNSSTVFARLANAGISRADAAALRRIAMTLDAWHVAECGTENGCIDRDETTGLPYWHNVRGGMRRIPDREAGALRRLEKIMDRYPELSAYVQGDCRGHPLYILRPGDVPEGADPESCYPNGIAVYK